VSTPHTVETSSAAPVLRTILRVVGWGGLGLMAVAVALSDFLARAPAGALGIGPMLEAPSGAHPFGTDLLGRDLLSESLHGLSVTMSHALLASLVAIMLGGLFGAVSARLPRYAGLTLRGIAGVFAAIPALLLAILVIGLTARDYAAVAAGLAAVRARSPMAPASLRLWLSRRLKSPALSRPSPMPRPGQLRRASISSSYTRLMVIFSTNFSLPCPISETTATEEA